MNFTLALMGLSIYLLIWEKLPDWGTWFNKVIVHLPEPLAYLYSACAHIASAFGSRWHCIRSLAFRPSPRSIRQSLL